MDGDDDVSRKLTRFGERRDDVRAVILTSSRAKPDAPCDILSDYDVILYVLDVAPLAGSEEWFREIGPVLISIQPGFEESGRWVCTRLALYEDGTKIDFTVRPVADLEALAGTGTPPDDHGYAVLVDKDGLTASLGPPTYTQYVPAAPTAAEYADIVTSFWWDSTYVARHLWREDVMAVKLMLDYRLKQGLLRPMLEWGLEIERHWRWRPGAHGRGLVHELDAETRRELLDTYAGADIGELWESLSRTTALFRRAAVAVAERLGYEYPRALDGRVTAYLGALMRLDRQTVCADELRSMLAKGQSTLGG